MNSFAQLRAERRQANNYQNTTLESQRAPDLTGPSGSLWRINMVATAARKPNWMATVGIWLLHAPDAHPSWEYYVIMLMHLRAVEGLPPPNKTVPLSEYAVTCVCLDPREPVPNIEELENADGGGLAVLLSMEFEAQFPAVPGGDAYAYEIIDDMAAAVVAGTLVPDLDYKLQWVQVLGMKLHEKANMPMPRVS